MKQITNYYDLINAFRGFAADHKQIKCFGYGTMTDIESPVDPTTGLTIQRDYPYMFIHPTNHTYTSSTLTFRFNVIVMELTSETTPMGFPGIHTTIKAQSDALRILNDFLAWIEYNEEWDTMLIKNVGIMPFQERFQDTVAGMTATVELQIPNKLNLCEAPIYQDDRLILAVQKLEEQLLNPTAIYLTGNSIYETGDWWQSFDTFTTELEATDVNNMRVELTANLVVSPNGSPWPDAFVIEFDNEGVISDIPASEIVWPNPSQVNQQTSIKLVWDNLDLDWIDALQFDRFKFRLQDPLNGADLYVTQLQIKFYEGII